MNKYKAEIPLILQYRRDGDSRETTYDSEVHVAQFTVRLFDVECFVSERPTGTHVTITEILCKTEDEAYSLAIKTLTELCVALSFDIESSNLNKHLGHLRFTWRNKDIIITPHDQAVQENVAIQGILTLQSPQTPAILSKVSTDPTLGFVLRAYYNALSPLDFKSKYYNAFVIIEYLETHFTAYITTTPLLSTEQMEALQGATETALSGMGLDREKSKRISSRAFQGIKDPKSGTEESRNEKLSLIFTDFFGIKTIRFNQEIVAVDQVLTKTLIDVRNYLFHAGKSKVTDGDLARYTNLLLILIELVVQKLL